MFGWVDFTEGERRRAAEIMNLVRYPGAIDELGIGVLRDGFANILFPATSTLHTHARYYYLVAYLMKDLEREHAGKSYEQLKDLQRRGEMETARRLVAWSKQQRERVTGITGSDSLDSGWVKMTPASMDWAAIQQLGILRSPHMKLNGFLHLVSASKKSDFADARPEKDSESPAEVVERSCWDVPLGSYRFWREGDELSLKLAEDEAVDLRTRIVERFPDSLYAVLLNYQRPVALWGKLSAGPFNCASFIRLVDGGVLESAGLKPEQKTLCSYAADLSALACLLHIRFNYVIRRQAEVSLEGDEAAQLWEELAYDDDSPYRQRVEQMSIDEVIKASRVPLDDLKNQATRNFLRQAQEAYMARNLSKLDALLAAREKRLKGEPRSKIANAKAYADDWFGGNELTYRLEVALMVAHEIAMTLGDRR